MTDIMWQSVRWLIVAAACGGLVYLFFMSVGTAAEFTGSAPPSRRSRIARVRPLGPQPAPIRSTGRAARPLNDSRVEQEWSEIVGHLRESID